MAVRAREGDATRDEYEETLMVYWKKGRKKNDGNFAVRVGEYTYYVFSVDKRPPAPRCHPQKNPPATNRAPERVALKMLHPIRPTGKSCIPHLSLPMAAVNMV
jgi:hypothetical protein